MKNEGFAVCLSVVHLTTSHLRNSLMKRSAINRRTPFLKMHALGNHFILVDARERHFLRPRDHYRNVPASFRDWR